MRTQPDTKENSAPFLIPTIQPSMPWRVASVQALPDFKLNVRFLDGIEGVMDLTPLIFGQHAGVFAVLADSELFKQVFVSYGAVTWPGEIDLAPDAMYTKIKQS